jgi:mRNA interferase RelE/StbE
MTWRIEFTRAAARQIAALPLDVRERLRRAIEDRLLADPKGQLIPLTGNLRGYAKFRVGDYRLICHRDDGVLLVLVVKVDHRRDVYR